VEFTVTTDRQGLLVVDAGDGKILARLLSSDWYGSDKHWLAYDNTTRPDHFLGEFTSAEKAVEYVKKYFAERNAVVPTSPLAPVVSIYSKPSV